MPAKVAKRGSRWRIVEPGGKLVRNKVGAPVDGGGHKDKGKAERQAAAVNMPKSIRKARFE